MVVLLLLVLLRGGERLQQAGCARKGGVGVREGGDGGAGTLRRAQGRGLVGWVGPGHRSSHGLKWLMKGCVCVLVCSSVESG